MTTPIIIKQIDTKIRTIIDCEPDKVYLEEDYFRCVGSGECDERGDGDDGEEWKAKRVTYDYDIVFTKEHITEIKLLLNEKTECYGVYIYTTSNSPLGFDFTERIAAYDFHKIILSWRFKK